MVRDPVTSPVTRTDAAGFTKRQIFNTPSQRHAVGLRKKKVQRKRKWKCDLKQWFVTFTSFDSGFTWNTILASDCDKFLISRIWSYIIHPLFCVVHNVIAAWIIWKQDNQAYSCFYRMPKWTEVHSLCRFVGAMCWSVLYAYDIIETEYGSCLLPVLASGWYGTCGRDGPSRTFWTEGNLTQTLKWKVLHSMYLVFSCLGWL